MPSLKIPKANPTLSYDKNLSDNDINNEEQKLSYEEKLKKIYEERLEYQKKIKQLDDEEKKNSSKNNQDSINYLNSLLEEYFNNVYLRNKDYDKIKQKVKEDNDRFQNRLIEDFLLFRNRQKHALEKLQNKYYIINRRKNNLNCLDEKAEL